MLAHGIKTMKDQNNNKTFTVLPILEFPYVITDH